MRGWVQKTQLPSACASGFKVWAFFHGYGGSLAIKPCDRTERRVGAHSSARQLVCGQALPWKAFPRTARANPRLLGASHTLSANDLAGFLAAVSKPRLQQVLPQDPLHLGYRLKLMVNFGVAGPHVEFTHHAGIAGA